MTCGRAEARDQDLTIFETELNPLFTDELYVLRIDQYFHPHKGIHSAVGAAFYICPAAGDDLLKPGSRFTLTAAIQNMASPFAGRLTVDVVCCLSVGGMVAVVKLLMVLFGLRRRNH